jgi:hypothetical protein
MAQTLWTAHKGFYPCLTVIQNGIDAFPQTSLDLLPHTPSATQSPRF